MNEGMNSGAHEYHTNMQAEQNMLSKIYIYISKSNYLAANMNANTVHSQSNLCGAAAGEPKNEEFHVRKVDGKWKHFAFGIKLLTCIVF